VVKDVSRFTRHAEHMYYPQFRQRLRDIVTQSRSAPAWRNSNRHG
jgi:hypothetical protein